MVTILKNLIKKLSDSMSYSLLIKNAVQGLPNSQYELAKFFLLEKKDYIEAYAWAELAIYRKNSHAINIKTEAEKHLHSEQIKIAWDKARDYKIRYS